MGEEKGYRLESSTSETRDGVLVSSFHRAGCSQEYVVEARARLEVG